MEKPTMLTVVVDASGPYVNEETFLIFQPCELPVMYQATLEIAEECAKSVRDLGYYLPGSDVHEIAPDATVSLVIAGELIDIQSENYWGTYEIGSAKVKPFLLPTIKLY